jgi:hypothetical protein
VNGLLYALFALVVLSGYLTWQVGKYLVFAPELVSGVIFLVLILKIGLNRSIPVSGKYLLLAAVAGLHLVVGILTNMVGPGTVLNGLRPYLKLMPMFLLPAVFQVSETDVRRQLRFLLALALLQCPVAFYQRFVEFRDVATGDVITGTLGTNASNNLSVFLVAAIAVLFSFYLAKRVRFVTFLILGTLLFLPTTINETKGTVFLLPLAILVPLFYARGSRFRVWQYAVAGVVAVAAIASYVAIYNHLASQLGREQLASAVGGGRQAAKYLYRGNDVDLKALENRNLPDVRLPKEQIDPNAQGRRVDNLLLPLKYYYQNDPVRLWVGSGVGNTSEAFIKSFSGVLAQRVSEGGSKSMLMSLVLWDMGLGGVVLVLVFLYLLFRDAQYLVRQKTEAATFAIGWLAVLGIALLTTAYVNMLYANALGYLFVYFSGYIAAERYRMGVVEVRRVRTEGTVSSANRENRKSEELGATFRMRSNLARKTR